MPLPIAAPSTRRLVRAAFVPLALLALLAAARQEDAAVRVGEGEHVFEWVRGWAQLPERLAERGLGNTHGCVVVDGQDRVYVNTDAEDAVLVFDREGQLLSSWGPALARQGIDLSGGLHGMLLVEEEGEERLLLAHTGRHEVLGATLEGEILWTLGWPEASGHYASAEAYRPTSLALGPDGRLFVADGYGASWIHEYEGAGSERRYVRSFGGPGAEPGRLATPHGLFLDPRGEEPLLLVADRENHRLQGFSLEGGEGGEGGTGAGEPALIVADLLRRPCHMQARGDVLAVADLAGRVSLLGRANELLVHLGEQPDPAKRAQNGIPRAAWRDGEFVSPHCVAWDSHGDLYVVDWLAEGRITKLRRVR